MCAAIVSASRVGNNCGKKRGPLGVQRRGPSPKIMAGGSFGSVNPVAPFNLVQVELQDPPFPQDSLHLRRDQRFVQLAQWILRCGQEQILCQLLADGRGASVKLFLLPVLLKSFLNLFPVKPRLVKESRILSRKDRSHQGRGQPLIRDPGLFSFWSLPGGSCFVRPLLDKRGGRRIRVLQPDNPEHNNAVIEQRGGRPYHQHSDYPFTPRPALRPVSCRFAWY